MKDKWDVIQYVIGIGCLVALVVLVKVGPPNNSNAHTEWLGYLIGLGTLSVVNLMSAGRA